MAWEEEERLRWRWEWARDASIPVLRGGVSVLIVGVYIFFLHDRLSAGALKAAQALFDVWSSRVPWAWGPISLTAMVLVYLLHLAIPAGFVLVLLLAIIGNGRADDGSTSKAPKGLGWVWIAGVVGLAAPFLVARWMNL